MNPVFTLETKMDRQRVKLRVIAVTTFIAAACITLGLSGCGKQAFVVSAQQSSSNAPGNFVIPAKVDILFMEDDTGSMYEARSGINSQIPAFLETLQNSGWNYHFAVSTLVKNQGITKAVASKHDSNWGSEWTPAYPGQQSNEAGMLSSSVFQKPNTDLGIIYESSIDSSYAGKEPGIENIYNTVKDGMTSTSGFFREDALTVVFVLSAGEDTSRIKFCKRNDGGTDLESAGNCTSTVTTTGSSATRFCGDPNVSYSECGFSEYGYDGRSSSATAGYESRFKALKSTGLLRMYAAVGGGTSCDLYQTSSSFRGDRYASLASRLGGKSYTLCTQSISNLFSSLASDLQGIKVQMQTKYIFVEAEPDVSTIVVRVKRSNGTEEVLKQDASNGWTYRGYLKNVYTIDYPVNLNKASGYALELNGSAKLKGDDTASIEFKAKGIQDNAR